MFINKKNSLFLTGLIAVAGAQAETRITVSKEIDPELERVKTPTEQFLERTDSIIKGPFERINHEFRVDGKNGSEEHLIMTAEEFNAYKNLMEFSVNGLRVVTDENDAEISYIVFSDNLGFERNIHFCGIKKAGFVDKLMMFVKTKNYKVFLGDLWVRVNDNSYTHVAIGTSLKINPFDINGTKSRMYPNVTMEQTVGNLPGIRHRVDGKTGKKGKFCGFSCTKVKDGDVSTYLFGKLTNL